VHKNGLVGLLFGCLSLLTVLVIAIAALKKSKKDQTPTSLFNWLKITAMTVHMRFSASGKTKERSE